MFWISVIVAPSQHQLRQRVAYDVRRQCRLTCAVPLRTDGPGTDIDRHRGAPL